MLWVVCGKFYGRIEKNTLMTSSLRHFMLLGFENLRFVRLNIDYQPAKFENSWLSGSNFMEVDVRHQKHHYDVIMTLFLITEFPN